MLRPGMVVVDVGANIGLFSAVAASIVGRTGRVVAVEPEARNCAFIHRTLQRNGFTQVEVVQAAVAARCGAGELFLNEENKADHRIFAAGSRDPRRSVAVELLTLDELVARQGLPRVDVLKMDIQGAEGAAFEGMPQVLRDNHDIVVLMEFWPWGLRQAGSDPAALLRAWRELGFGVVDLDGDGRRLVPVHDDEVLLRRDLERHHNNLLLRRQPAQPA
jgi:FkbM family methyltransferase